jgi:hypothetical protein
MVYMVDLLGVVATIMLSAAAVHELGNVATSLPSLSSRSTGVNDTNGSGIVDDTPPFSLAHFLDHHVLPAVSGKNNVNGDSGNGGRSSLVSNSSLASAITSPTCITSLNSYLTELQSYASTLDAERAEQQRASSHDAQMKQLRDDTQQVLTQVRALQQRRNDMDSSLQRFLTTNDTQRLATSLQKMHHNVASVQVTFSHHFFFIIN